jgi:hypothetical protein
VSASYEDYEDIKQFLLDGLKTRLSNPALQLSDKSRAVITGFQFSSSKT